MIGGHVRNYTPASHPINAFKFELRSLFEGQIIAGPCYCHITAIFPRPKSKTKKTGTNPRLPHTSKPDTDNLAKAVCDALNGVAWKDDSQVCRLTVTKLVAAADEESRTIVEVGEYVGREV
jgi:Holliday junction resolvase RusA-like endonuclease